ncbi:MAG: transposase, partial [Victivallaceae bacterium]|nr:transposase [Victivallaceae bacterium]
MGQERQNYSSKHVKRPYCPFKNFCIFLNGEDPDRILTKRDYLSKRVDELEFAMDIGNHQALKLQDRIKELEDANSQLKTELSDALKDPFTKYKRKETTETTKKLGAPVGHPGWFRRKPEQADKTIDVYLDNCPHCGSKDISPCNHTTEHIQEDIEDGKPVSTCFIHCYYWCPNCGQVVHGWGVNEIPNAFIGPDARAKAAFLRYEIKVSYDDVQQTLQYMCGLAIVPGSIVGLDNKLAEKAAPVYEELKQSLQENSFIHVDETGWKRDWLWIFTNPYIAFFHIDESLASEAKTFLTKVKDLFKDAIFLHNMHLALSNEEYRSACKEIRTLRRLSRSNAKGNRFKKLRSHPELEHHKTDNIRKRLITFKDELFVFLKYTAVPPTNNPAAYC